MKREHQTLSLLKSGHRFVFRYAVGRETELLAAFLELAGDPDSPFDWLDAAVLSYQMGQQLRTEELDPVV